MASKVRFFQVGRNQLNELEDTVNGWIASLPRGAIINNILLNSNADGHVLMILYSTLYDNTKL